MTANSLRYHELQENIRHNKMMEQVQSRDVAEKGRHNLVTEVETQRSNLAKEAENTRSAQAKEGIDTAKVLEDKRHNIEQERQTAIVNRANIDVNTRRQDETERSNRMHEWFTSLGLTETQRHNLATEGIQNLSARASASQAAAALQNAATNASHQAMLQDQWDQVRPYAGVQAKWTADNVYKSGLVSDSIINMNNATTGYTTANTGYVQQKTATEGQNTRYTKEKADNEQLRPMWNMYDATARIVDAVIPF